MTTFAWGVAGIAFTAGYFLAHHTSNRSVQGWLQFLFILGGWPLDIEGAKTYRQRLNAPKEDAE